VRVRRTDRERSRTVLRFDALQRIHASTAAVAAQRPSANALAAAAALPAPADGERLPLPPPVPMPMRLTTVLRRRRSSFGRFAASRPISAAQLGTSLAASAAGTQPTEIDTPGDGSLTKLYAFVNHVSGVPAGTYEYVPRQHALRRVRAEPPGYFLQRNYFLANYNLEQAAAVLVPCIRTHAVLDAVGERGYNLVNATIGAVAQHFYLSAAALDLGAGVALGFDNISYIEYLGIAATGEAPLLIMMLGNERPDSGDYRYELGWSR
jgi:SagB-type dehydrogenase family enzyme